MKEKDLKGAYVDRDVSWMYFNHRILREAQKEDLPLLERLSFLGIYSAQLQISVAKICSIGIYFLV